MKTVSRKIRKPLIIVLLLIGTIVVTGCEMRGTIRWETSWYHVSGKVTFGEGGPPIVGARVTFSGDRTVSAVTDRNGKYSLSGVTKGDQRITVVTMHQEYTFRRSISGNTVIDIPVYPGGWYSRDMFRELSGIQRYNGNGWWDWSELTRWTLPSIVVDFSVHKDLSWADIPTGWESNYFSKVREWETYLNNRITFRKGTSRPSADVKVALVPEKSLISNTGQRQVAVVRPSGHSGTINQVEVYIDVYFARDIALWNHLWARSMGVGLTSDSRSVMYYRFTPGGTGRDRLSSAEIRHIQLMYELPPGTKRQPSWGLLSTDGFLADGEGFLPAGGREEFVNEIETELVWSEVESGELLNAYGMSPDGEVTAFSQSAIDDMLEALDWDELYE